jgi:hypothetical protein
VSGDGQLREKWIQYPGDKMYLWTPSTGKVDVTDQVFANADGPAGERGEERVYGKANQ